MVAGADRRYFARPLRWAEHDGRFLAVNRLRPGWAMLNETAAWIVRYCERTGGADPAAIAAGFRHRFGEVDGGELGEWLADLEGTGVLASSRDGAPPPEPQPLRPPDYQAYKVEHMYVELLARCNLRCVHCFMEGAPERDEILEPEEVRRVLAQFRAAGGQFVTLAGGEPTIYPAFEETVREVARLGFYGTVVSNGITLRESHLELLHEQGFNLAISLDGITPEVNEKIRGRGTRKAKATLERALEVLGTERVILSFTPVKANLGDLPNLFAFAEERGIRRLNLSLYEEVGRAPQHRELLNLTPQERIRLMELVYRNALRLAGKIEIDFNDTREILSAFRCDRQPQELHPLWKGVRLTSSGDVYPSSFGSADEYRLGNVRQTPLDQVVRSETLRELYDSLLDRHHKIEACRQCVWQHTCRGGSVTSAYYGSGQLFAPDSYCEGYKRMYPEVLVSLATMGSGPPQQHAEAAA